ncbi:MAG: diaminopimelate epimerase [Candidatus Omnitrophota bacterium]
MKFYKLQASGNDFILLDKLRAKAKSSLVSYQKFARKYCCRCLGIGADGVLAIEPSLKADFKLRIFNADGSEAEMCGNGARSVGFWAYQIQGRRSINFETKAGIIEAKVVGSGRALTVKVKTSTPSDLAMDLLLKTLGRKLRVNFINTGVPHTVIFVEGLDKINVERIGRAVRFHRQFQPAGTNVNFVELRRNNSLAVRTYERGVEAETLACGTGAIASAIISWFKFNPRLGVQKTVSMSVATKSGDSLRVTFSAPARGWSASGRKGGSASSGVAGEKIINLWLEGKAGLVYKGEITGI